MCKYRISVEVQPRIGAIVFQAAQIRYLTLFARMSVVCVSPSVVHGALCKSKHYNLPPYSQEELSLVNPLLP